MPRNSRVHQPLYHCFWNLNRLEQESSFNFSCVWKEVLIHQNKSCYWWSDRVCTLKSLSCQNEEAGSHGFTAYASFVYLYLSDTAIFTLHHSLSMEIISGLGATWKKLNLESETAVGWGCVALHVVLINRVMIARFGWHLPLELMTLYGPYGVADSESALFGDSFNGKKSIK